MAAVLMPSPQAPAPAQPTAQPSPGPATPQTSSGSPSPLPQQAAPAQLAYSGPVVVLNPAHGGTDTGARGQGGVIEKDIVLQFARVARGELVRQGYRVVLTRDDDSNPSYDDRAAIANSYRDAIFVSIHISSTGTPGTARAYYYQFWRPLPTAPQSGSSGPEGSRPPISLSAAPTTALLPWNEAQRPYADVSQRLADQLQIQLSALLSGSPQTSAGVELRGLRSVAAPAVDVEVSSVSVPDVRSLTVMAGPLAVSITKGMQTFRPPNSMGAK
jgi:N-acetylmuramoyl-L-alanine amidase